MTKMLDIITVETNTLETINKDWREKIARKVKNKDNRASRCYRYIGIANM